MDEASFSFTSIVYLVAGSIVMLILVVQWMAWIFRWGRFKPLTPEQQQSHYSESKLRYMLVKLITEIINDFRHLLALVIIGVFAVVILVVIYAGWGQFEQVLDGIQLVVASLGGLIGSIIGYYFGESAAEKKYRDNSESYSLPENIQAESTETDSGVRVAKPPQSLESTDDS